MTVYYYTIAMVMIFSLLAQAYDFKHETIIGLDRVKHTQITSFFLLLASSTLIFVSGFRYYVGTDYHAYFKNYYYYVNDVHNSVVTLDEPGLKILYWVSSWISESPFIPLFLCALLTIGLSTRTIYRYTDQVFFATMLYVFLGCWHSSFNAIRQCFAGMIVFCGIEYLRDKKFIKYFVCVLVGYLFHKSAIIMLIPYFLVNRKVTVKNLIILTGAVIIVLLSYETLFSITSNILQDDSALETGYALRSVNVLRIVIAAAPAAFFLILFYKREKTVETTFHLNICIIHAAFMIMAANSAYLARVGIYTAPFCAISIPELMKAISSKNRRTVSFFVLILYAVYFFYEIRISSSLNHFQWIFPYI